MSAASSLLSEDQFLCSICLDVFTDPVSTPCGHNFCKKCITTNWDLNFPCQCPNCKKTFNTRPELQVNTFISEMVAHFRKSAEQKTGSSSEKQAVQAGEVPCDVCTGTKLKALKSCLVCLVSYCETHLEPHVTMPGLKRHQLIDPVTNLESRMCTKHDKLLELFCKDDQTCVCMLCTISEHKVHEVVPLEEEYEGKKAELGKKGAELLQMIQERQLKIEELKRSVEVSWENAYGEIKAGVCAFTKLKYIIQRNQTKVIEMIEEKHKTTEKQADGFIKELQEEISELKKKSAELEQVSHSEDHCNLLQNFPSLNAAPPTKDWKEVRVHLPSYDGSVRTTVAQLVEMVENEMKKLFPKADLKTAQQSAVEVTLDPDTANPELILSEDGKQVHHGNTKRNLPNNPERFSYCACVLGKPIDYSGRFYFEVQVKGKTQWVVGVAKESVNRKGRISINHKNGYWTVCLSKETVYCASTDPPVRLPLKAKLEKVGVFVDYEQGLVFFYDVNAADLIYAFTGCSFTEKLLPLFCPSFNQGGKNSAPLIICPVNPTK
ncbi:E3 ubiquitin-protein ligase TRIM21 [Larimichthys crocea]|uniref:E3 ubiquitin-protein ligase TRIM21 n=1 Tax=Larimichthys crocea TaxID=215358 RepID=UPI000F5DC250|nr:E3 ubiquitin-protein ligase TRIM21 [Larimichthys crocea]